MREYLLEKRRREVGESNYTRITRPLLTYNGRLPIQSTSRSALFLFRVLYISACATFEIRSSLSFSIFHVGTHTGDIPRPAGGHRALLIAHSSVKRI